MNEKYGVPRETKSSVKIYGMLIRDISLVIGAALFSVISATKIFPSTQILQMILYIFLIPLLVIYLLLPHNGGKRNYNAILLVLWPTRHRRRYTSISPLEMKKGDKAQWLSKKPS
ncbi:DUF5592 family protein [Streptococcus sobrinus]|uniref:DUF5592 family protein n=1 Tax=Streptococcus sobrinus TaxID=1310 RepID=UPI0003679556|nr:DUF5592 family protein [Streptococcus sobrinus]